MGLTNNQILAREAAKEHPLPDGFRWDSGNHWVGIIDTKGTWRWWAYTDTLSGREKVGIVCCREKSEYRKVAHVEFIADAIPLMAHKLLFGVWE